MSMIKEASFKPGHTSKKGMFLEGIINNTLKYCCDNSIANIHKKPVPIKIVKTSKGHITSAFFEELSTLDYIGIYKGNYIEFDAKETSSTTSFPLANIATHQYEHLKSILNHGGISFIIIYMNDMYFLLDGNILLNFIKENNKKSIPLKFLIDNAFQLKYNYIKGLNIIEGIDRILEENNGK